MLVWAFGGRVTLSFDTMSMPAANGGNAMLNDCGSCVEKGTLINIHVSLLKGVMSDDQLR